MEHGRRQRRAVSERDRISDLSDDLLHVILLHLRSTPAAARTSALSRRWRRVWESVPDIVLADDRIHHGACFLDRVDDASFLDTVDGALAAYAAGPSVRLRALQIVIPYKCQNVPAGRVAAWLLVASQRLAGELDLGVAIGRPHNPVQGEIELPSFERATRITLVLGNRFLLRTPPAGVFAALTDLNIMLAFMDAGALEVLVSSLCPRLEKLTLLFVKLANDSDVSISSTSLRHLTFNVNKTRRLDVVTPNLQELCLSMVADADIHVAAPNLAMLASGSVGQLFFADAVRHLRQLEVKDWSAIASSSLLRQLDTVDELRLRAPMKEEEFQRFMDVTETLPECETLSVSFAHNAHGPVSSVLHLLRRRGSRIKKLVVLLEHRMMAADRCSLVCPCRSPESAMTHGISLDSLEEIEFRLIQRGDEYMEVLERLLSIDSVTKLKNVEVNVSVQQDAASLSDEVYRKVRGICPPNIGVKVNVSPNGRWQNQN